MLRDDGPRRRPRIGAQHELLVGEQRQSPGAAAPVRQPQARDLDWIAPRHEQPRVVVQAVARVPAAAVAEPVPHLVVRRGRRRPRQRRPELAGLLVAHVQRLPVGIEQRVVAPRRQPVLATVAAPRGARSGLAHEASELLVREHVDPRRRRQAQARAGPVLETHDVLAAVLGESTVAVERGEPLLLASPPPRAGARTAAGGRPGSGGYWRRDERHARSRGRDRAPSPVEQVEVERRLRPGGVAVAGVQGQRLRLRPLRGPRVESGALDFRARLALGELERAVHAVPRHERQRQLTIVGRPKQHVDRRRLIRLEPHHPAQAHDRIEHVARGPGQPRARRERERCGLAAPASDEPEPVGLVLEAPGSRHGVHQPRMALVTAARAPAHEQCRELGHELRLQEQLRERGVRGECRRAIEDHFRIARDLDPPRPSRVVVQRDAADLERGDGGHARFEAGFDAVVAPRDLVPAGAPHGPVISRTAWDRLAPCRPCRPVLEVPQVDEVAVAVRDG